MTSIAEETAFELSNPPLKTYAKTWKPVGVPTVAQVIFLHGFFDHIDPYDDIYREISAKGIEIFLFDQRGWGKTAPKKNWAITGGHDQVMKDIGDAVRARKGDLPLFLWGHSMGGNIALTYGLAGELRNDLAGIIGESPWVTLTDTQAPPAIAVATLRQFAKIVPNQKLFAPLIPEKLSHDKAVVDAIKKDDLAIGYFTFKGLTEVIADGKKLLQPANAAKFNLPVIILHGAADQITSHDNSKKFIDLAGSKDKTFVSIPGAYHQLHAELPEMKARYVTEVVNWILARSKSH